MKVIKNRMSSELLEWARERHGRFAKIATACGVSKRQVFAWSIRECGIAPRHHAKIFEIAGGILPTEIRYIESCALKKMWDFCVKSGINRLHRDAFFLEMSRRGEW